MPLRHRLRRAPCRPLSSPARARVGAPALPRALSAPRAGAPCDAGAVFHRSALGAAVLLALASAAQALPQDGSVIAGSGSIGTAGNAMTVTQHTQKLIIDWQGFGIAAGESVQFIQPGSDAVALNRVLGNNASAIFGSLSANGQVFLVNPNGILFGSGAQVNVGGLVASTLGISNNDFLAGNYSFAGSGGSVVNQGALTAADGGVIALLAPEVRNEGIIVAKEGSIGLGAGTRVTLGFANGFTLEVEESALNAVIENRHALRAEGGAWMPAARRAATSRSRAATSPSSGRKSVPTATAAAAASASAAISRAPTRHCRMHARPSSTPAACSAPTPPRRAMAAASSSGPTRAPSSTAASVHAAARKAATAALPKFPASRRWALPVTPACRRCRERTARSCSIPATSSSAAARPRSHSAATSPTATTPGRTSRCIPTPCSAS
ncbi:MAG: filamentous hemagglutinin family outer membrane protein [Moraxellaceae bacterium]|nr:filamentous hemagglutinin family outer membrane protein [Moraxellaceae bacterium]